MQYIVWIVGLVVLSACSMRPSQKEQRSNTIRIIKEEPIKYTSQQKYNTKIENVDYNSSIIAPEIDPNYTKRKVRKPRNNVESRGTTTKSTSKVTAHVEKQKKKVTKKITKKVESKVTRSIENSIDSLFE